MLLGCGLQFGVGGMISGLLSPCSSVNWPVWHTSVAGSTRA